MRKTIAIATAALIINILIIEKASANECWRIERQLNKANYMLNRGGDASYMKLWRQARDHNAEELPKCRKRFGEGDTSIRVAKGSSTGTNRRYANEQLRPINTNNPNLRKVIETCNFWIHQHNQNANEDNRVMRNTACRNAANMEREIASKKGQEEFKAVRSLKECAKPNNVIDNDVKLCMQGTKEPNWVVAENKE